MATARSLGALLAVASLVRCSCDHPPAGGGGTAAAPSGSTALDAPSATAATATNAARAPRPGLREGAATDPFRARIDARQKTVEAVSAAFNAHDAKALAALYDPACIVRSPGRGTFAIESGREPIVVGHNALFASQPDVKSATSRLLVAGDHAVQEWVTTGTNAASGKPVGFRAGTVYRFGGDGKIVLDATYFDLLTPAVQSGRRKGIARPIPALPEKATVVIANEGSRDPPAVVTLKKLYAALQAGHGDVGGLLTDDVVQVTPFSADDVSGREAVTKELLDLLAQLPVAEVGSAWGDGRLAAAEIVLQNPAKPGAFDAKLHVLHVIDTDDGHIHRSTIYANRRELEEE